MSFILAANWKMNKGPAQARAFFDQYKKNQSLSGIKTLFFVSSVNASVTGDALEGTDLYWGPQNIFPAAHGAFTGETSPQVMKDLGASYVLVGHSERRKLFFESDQQTNVKLHSASEFGLNPVLCVGETFEERKQGRTLEVLNRQLIIGLSNLEPKGELHIAYEPVWAIGTGEVASIDQVSEAHQFIRKFLSEKLPHHHDNIKILYGGSVKPENARELSQGKEVSGFLIGGASLDPEIFFSIARAIKG